MSCNTNSSTINKTFIIESIESTDILSACTSFYANNIISCSGDTEILLTSGATIFNTDLVPITPDTISVGRPTRRFRELNTVSGTTSVWTVTTRVNTPELNLGLDSSGNTRIITANNSIIQDDILFGGGF
jgi:hypothetical protein